MKNYYLVLDTETCPLNPILNKVTGWNMLVYDIGYCIIDKKGNIYESGSYIVDEIFNNNRLMKSAYYGFKKPLYINELALGEHIMLPWTEVIDILNVVAEKYCIKGVYAYNAYFDMAALTTTNRFLKQGNYYPLENYNSYDIMKIAERALVSQKAYGSFCDKHNFKTTSGRNRKNAETVYRYITDNPHYIEEHTGLQDALIESEILVKSLRQKKKTEDCKIDFTVYGKR